jgi:hypothetical protein
MTILVTTTNNGVPVVLDLRSGTNTSIDFARFVVWAVRRRYLSRGDFLIMDGAKVHFAENVGERLSQFLRERGVLSSPCI